MKKWLLREQPEEKHDIRLWQTFRNIDLQTTIKLHEENPNQKTASTLSLPPDSVVAVVSPSRAVSVVSSNASARFVEIFSGNLHSRCSCCFAVYQTLAWRRNLSPEKHRICKVS